MRVTCGLLLALATVSAGPSIAQSRCGDTHVLSPGETLFAMTQTCRVSMERVHRLNPELDLLGDVSAGTTIRLAPRRGAREAESRLPPTYRVAEGDTAVSIANSFGISFLELLHRNGNVDPQEIEPGDVLEVPDEDRGAPVFVQPLSGPPGTEVTLRAGSFRPGDFVTIGAGASAASWSPIRQARIGDDGRLEETVHVPENVRPGEILTFFVNSDRGAVLKSRDFDVLPEKAEEAGPVSIEGRIRRGVQCPTLTTPDGDLYSLVAGDRQFLPGDYVQIEGDRTDMAACQQGIAAVEVTSMTEIRAPGNLPRATAAPKPEEVVGAWAPKGGDCGKPAFRVSREGERIAVETVLDGSTRSGRIAFAGDMAYIAFEMPYQEFGLERRGDGELALIAPAGTAISIGDIALEHGERVFVRCLG